MSDREPEYSVWQWFQFFIAFLAVGFVFYLIEGKINPAGSQDMESMEHYMPDHWYDLSCCSRKDCRRARPGELSWSPEGWLHHPSGMTFPHKYVRAIPDKAPDEDKLHMHVCIFLYDGYSHAFKGQVKKGSPRCIYQQRAGG